MSQREPVCGNAIVEDGEQCDDGNRRNGDVAADGKRTSQRCPAAVPSTNATEEQRCAGNRAVVQPLPDIVIRQE